LLKCLTVTDGDVVDLVDVVDGLKIPMNAARAVVGGRSGFAFFVGCGVSARGADAITGVSVPPLAAFGALTAATTTEVARWANGGRALTAEDGREIGQEVIAARL
jgi:hypothetical protein